MCRYCIDGGLRSPISASFVSSPVLNITHINRAHMGTYVCEAFNGVPPNDTQEFNVHVYCEY